jgi:ankyrin repeat protein
MLESSLAFCGEIHNAAKQSDLEKVNALLNQHPDLVFSKANNGNTPLGLAAQNGRVAIAVLPLTSKAEVDARQSNLSSTPLMMDALSGRANVAKVLLAHGANPDLRQSMGFTSLRMAAMRVTDQQQADQIRAAKSQGQLLVRGNPDDIPGTGPWPKCSSNTARTWMPNPP